MRRSLRKVRSNTWSLTALNQDHRLTSWMTIVLSLNLGRRSTNMRYSSMMISLRNNSISILRVRPKLLVGKQLEIQSSRYGPSRPEIRNKSLKWHQLSEEIKLLISHCSTAAKSSSKMWISPIWLSWPVSTKPSLYTLLTAELAKSIIMHSKTALLWTCPSTSSMMKTMFWFHTSTTRTKTLKSGQSSNINRELKHQLWTW